MTEVLDAPRTGRPRDPELDRRILRAALELMADGGYEALTVEGVAARAGVGKATVYRRWAGKPELVVDAVASLNDPPEATRGLSVRDELVVLLEAVRRKSRSTLAGKVFPHLLSASVDHPELLERYQERVIDPRRQRFLDVLARAADEGLLREDLDHGYAVDLLVGPLAYRNLLRSVTPPDPDLAARVVDDVLTALAPRGTT